MIFKEARVWNTQCTHQKENTNMKNKTYNSTN
jgi:hypothetical protein